MQFRGSVFCFKLNPFSHTFHIFSLHIVSWLSGTQPPSAVPSREPLLATPGACEATHILQAAQDGDLALSHFHWKTTASGYHRCQQWCQGGGVGHDAVGSSSCRGWRNLLCLHILPGSLAGWLRDAALLSCRASPLPAKTRDSMLCVHIQIRVHTTTLMTAVEIEVTLGC